MNSGYVTATAFWNGDRLRFHDETSYRLGLKALRLAVGDEVEVRIERLKAARTTAQNRAYWGYIVRPVSMFSHMPLNHIHRFFKAELLPAEEFVLADPDTGEVKLQRRLELDSTTRLSEPEFDAYMEHARALAMEQIGVDLSERGLFEQFGIMRG